MRKKKDFIVENDVEQNEVKSRSQKKRDCLALQNLGDILSKLTQGQLAKIPIDEELRQELEHLRQITNHEGRRRQKQYIGKLMRQYDPMPIEEALKDLQIVK